MNYITDNIFLGNSEDAHNYYALKANNITHILTSAIEQDRPFTDSFHYLYFPIYDNPQVDISPYFCRAIEFIIDSQRRGGNILIHCAAGVSRSASMVIAYLIVIKRMSFSEAKNFVEIRRPIINPNEGFQRQLINLSRRLLGKI
jgi:protein-tyrosine phosphatase